MDFPRRVVILYAIGMAALAVPFATKKTSEWDLVFIPTARHLVAGEDLYDQAHGYVYPPLQALLAAPMLPLPRLASRLAWFAVNAVALWIALRSAWRLAGGRDHEKPGGRLLVVAGSGLVVGLTYFFNALMHHQTDILVAALLFRGCEMLSTRAMTGAALIGVAAAMKCTPLLFVPYLMARRQWRAAGWLVAVAILASLLPDLVHSPADHSTWLSKWWNIFMVPMAGSGHRPGVWASDIIFNQSLIGALNRWTTTIWSWTGEGVRFDVIEPLLSPSMLKASILASAVALGGISFIALRRRADNAWGCSLVFCGMLLYSPMSSPAHFGVLLVPAWLLARAAMLNGSRMAAFCLGAMLLAAGASNKDLLGASLYSLGLWHGSVMLAAVAALIGCWHTLIVTSPPVEPESAPAGRY